VSGLWTWLRALSSQRGASLLALRLVVGAGFIVHGVAKLTRGPEHFAAILAAMGIPFPTVAAWTTSLAELLGGVALVLGLWVPAVAVPLAIVMVTAMVGVHWRYGFSSIRLLALTSAGAEFGPVGYELNLLYLGALLTLALHYPSPFSLDALRAKRRAPSTAPGRRGAATD
jgi:putative oxidoreductase